ncbi:MAG: hypothetical protein ABIH86_03065 [Planctomycetota bacterium]
MAKIEKKGTSPVVAALANFCCFGILGYILLGQASKGIMVLIVSIVLNLIGVGWIVALLGVYDAYLVAGAIEKGEEVDENEYKFELLYKLMKVVHKDAIFKGDNASTTPPAAQA